uniref:Uncharacterized protein n=1 Tax=Oryza rufipogon TaxID=4529 RepID=A0A0E0NQ00_ORYRU
MLGGEIGRWLRNKQREKRGEKEKRQKSGIPRARSGRAWPQLPGTPNVIFVGTEEDGIFAVELDSLSVRKVCELDKSQDLFFPFVSYYAESFLGK